MKVNYVDLSLYEQELSEEEIKRIEQEEQKYVEKGEWPPIE